MTYKESSDEIVKAWSSFYTYYIKHRPEVLEALANNLWGDFVDYKDVPFGDKEVWHE